MKKYLSLLLVSLFCITLSATNNQNSVLETQAHEGMYFQGHHYSSTFITAYLEADQPLTITCYITLSGANKEASYTIGGKIFNLSTNSSGGETRQEVTVSLPKGKSWVTIRSSDRRASSAAVNLFKINGQASSSSQLVLTPSW